MPVKPYPEVPFRLQLSFIDGKQKCHLILLRISFSCLARIWDKCSITMVIWPLYNARLRCLRVSRLFLHGDRMKVQV